MSETFGPIHWMAPLINTALAFLAGAFVLVRYRWNRLRQSVLLGLGLIFLAMMNYMEFGYETGLVETTAVPYALENSFLAISLALFYYGCAIFFTRRRLYTTFLASLFLVIQEIIIVYFYFIVNDRFPAILISVIFFAVPITIFAGYSFLLGYLSSKRRASLLIAVSFWMYSALGPIFYVVNLTPLEVVYHVLNAVTIAVMFTGFVMLALSKEKQSVLGRGMSGPAAKQAS